MSHTEADKTDIQRAEFIRTYYSGQETPAPVRANRFFYRRLGALAVLTLAIVSGAVTANYFLSRRPEPINISKRETPFPIRYHSQIAYYHYQQLKNMPGPIILGTDHNCVAVNLGQAKDLRGGVISFLSKGECGKERVAIILRDTNRISNANQDDIILTPVLDNGKWQPFYISLKQMYLPLDIGRVTQVRFKISLEHTKEDYPQAKVYIKDIAIK